MGYSAWGTAANSVGIALSMGLTRLQWLQGERDPAAGGQRRPLRAKLIFAYMKDIAYCRYCRPTIKDLTPEGIEQALLRQNMTTRVETALKDTALVTGPDGVTDYVIPEFRLTDFSAPLGRSAGSASASCSRMRVRGSRSSKKWELRFIAAAP